MTWLLITGAELGRRLRPEKPISRTTIHRWTLDGFIPASAIVYHGSRIRYKLVELEAAGWMRAAAAEVAHAEG